MIPEQLTEIETRVAEWRAMCDPKMLHDCSISGDMKRLNNKAKALPTLLADIETLIEHVRVLSLCEKLPGGWTIENKSTKCQEFGLETWWEVRDSWCLCHGAGDTLIAALQEAEIAIEQARHELAQEASNDTP